MRMVSLSDVLIEKLSNGRSVPTHTGSAGFPVLRLTALRDGRVQLSESKQGDWTREQAEPWVVREGDFLISRGNGSISRVGAGGLVGSPAAPVAFPDTMIRARVDPTVCQPDYLAAIWRSPGVRRQIENVARTTAGIYKVSQADLTRIRFQLPDLESQREIAALVDEARDRTTSLLRSAQHFGARASVASQAAIAGLLVPKEFPDDVPEGWAIRTLGEFADVVAGVTVDQRKQDGDGRVEVPYLRVANVQAGRLDLQTVKTIRVPRAKAEALVLRPGDVLMNEGGDRDKLGRGWVWQGEIENCIHQNHVFRVRINDDVLEPKLLSYFGNTWGRAWFEMNGKQSTNLASISLRTLRSLPVPVPPKSDQARLVATLDGVAESYTALRRGADKVSGLAEATFVSTLISLFGDVNWRRT